MHSTLNKKKLILRMSAVHPDSSVFFYVDGKGILLLKFRHGLYLTLDSR